MTLVDQFESVFRSAERQRYTYGRVDVRSVAVVTDLEPDPAASFLAKLREFMVEVDGDEVTWTHLGKADYGDLDALLPKLHELEPDIVVSYRNVGYASWRWPYSLGETLNVLTRETDYPVLCMPNPHERPDLEWSDQVTTTVMVLADHLTGDHRLVDWGVRFVRAEGTLYLTHVEDQAVFERYVDLISRIPSIDTTVATKDMLERLMKEPRDYIESCKEELLRQGHLTHEVVPVVTMGTGLDFYIELINQHHVDLLVFHGTKEHHDLALDGRSYSLAIKLRDIPILMI